MEQKLYVSSSKLIFSLFIQFCFAVGDRDLARTRFHIDEPYMDHKILDYVVKHNYTMNREAMIQAIKYLYTYWPDRRIDDKVRDQYIYVSCCCIVGLSLITTF